MKLFRRGAKTPTPADGTPAPPVPAYVPPSKSREIALSPEQKSLLEKPVDARVHQILNKVYADKATAERALHSRRIIDFPHSDSGERIVIQDEQGSWRIAPGTAPDSRGQLSDSP